jgi:hypothetical protein
MMLERLITNTLEAQMTNQMTNLLSMPLELPCGATLSNRLAKAAMSEGMADKNNHSTPRLETLYGLHLVLACFCRVTSKSIVGTWNGL